MPRRRSERPPLGLSPDRALKRRRERNEEDLVAISAVREAANLIYAIVDKETAHRICTDLVHSVDPRFDDNSSRDWAWWLGRLSPDAPDQ